MPTNAEFEALVHASRKALAKQREFNRAVVSTAADHTARLNGHDTDITDLKDVAAALAASTSDLVSATAPIPNLVTVTGDHEGRITNLEDGRFGSPTRALVLGAIGFILTLIFVKFSIEQMLDTVKGVAPANHKTMLDHKGWIEFIGAIFGGLAGMGLATFQLMPKNTTVVQNSTPVRVPSIRRRRAAAPAATTTTPVVVTPVAAGPVPVAAGTAAP